MAINRYYGTGRRKTSIAKVWIFPGKGNIIINNKPHTEYFVDHINISEVEKPLQIAQKMNEVDVNAKVTGGGFTGQSGAVRHGIARALIEYDLSLRPALKKEKLLERDARMKERDKYGKKGARASYQFSKR